MINVNQITAQLAKMPDASLQKYAAMNKNDPYIMALAVAESNRRKQLRQAAQGAQGMQEAPKVVDQALQGMAAPMPEDVGIARLPAGDMNFADGGIVAFADGGDVERYNGEFGSFIGGMGFGASPEQMAEDELRRQRLLQQREEEARYSALAEGRTPTPSVLPASATPAAAAAAAVPGPTSAAAPVVPPPAAQRDLGAGTAPGVGTGSAALQALFDKMQKANDPALKEIREARKELGEQLLAVPKKNLEDFDAEQAKRGDVFKGREERLRQREGEFGKMKNTSTGLALLQAGAAIMSTPGSLATALGKGINVGAERYAAGLDKLNAAKERLFDAKDRLEELRVNRDDLTAKERRGLQTAANNAVLDAKKLGLEGLTQELGYKREDAGRLFTGMTSILGTETTANAAIRAAQIRSDVDKSAYNAIRGASVVEQAKKNLADKIAKQYPYDAEKQRQVFATEWAQELKNNPTLAQYAGGVPGGGSAPANFVFNEKTGQLEPAR